MIRKNSATYFLLLALEKTIETEVNLMDFAYNNYALMYGFPRQLNYGDLYQSIKILRKNGFVESSKTAGKITVKLTDKGKEQAIIQQLLINDKWDGKWRLVIFDIPEKHRKLRNILRSKLREWEFIPWQKSVWAGKKDVDKQLKKFIGDIGLDQWVRVLVTTD